VIPLERRKRQIKVFYRFFRRGIAMQIVRSIRAGGIAAAVAVLVSACGAQSTKPERMPEEIVSERAEARWGLLVQRDFAAAYDYLSPGARSLQTREAYVAAMSPRPVAWTGASVRSVECPPAESFCKVLMEVAFSVKSPLRGVGRTAGHSVVEERWILSGGEWGFVPR
jgi:hypothetical protein